MNSNRIRVLDHRRRFLAFGFKRGFTLDRERIVEVNKEVFGLAAYAEDLSGPIRDVVFIKEE